MYMFSPSLDLTHLNLDIVSKSTQPSSFQAEPCFRVVESFLVVGNPVIPCGPPPISWEGPTFLYQGSQAMTRCQDMDGKQTKVPSP